MRAMYVIATLASDLGCNACRCLYELVAALNCDVLRTSLHRELLSPRGYVHARRFN